MTAKARLAAVSIGVSGAIAVICALVVFGGFVSDTYLVFRAAVLLSLPGMFLSMGTAGNVHAFSPVMTVLFNWIFYAVLIWLVQKVTTRARGN